MLMLDEAVLLAISTIRGVHNFFSRLRNLKDEKGEAVFNTVDFRVECKRPECEGRAENCPHILSQLPSHLSADKAERVKLLMSGEGDLYLQEIQNIESDPTEPMFGRHDIDWLFDPRNRFQQYTDTVPKYLVVSVDPNGGGLSNYAIVSLAIYESHSVIVGIEEKNTKGTSRSEIQHGGSFAAPAASPPCGCALLTNPIWRAIGAPPDPDEQREIFIGHIRALKERKEFLTCPVIVGVESNLGFEANHHEAYIGQESLNTYVCMLHESSRSDRSERSVGLQATNARKAQMAMLTRWSLQAPQRRYRICPVVTCVSGSADKVLHELQEQLYVFCRIVQPAPQIGGKPRIVYSGKHARSNDDLAMAFQWLELALLYFNSEQGKISYQLYHRMFSEN